jgi:hypothetical protein
VPARAAIGEDVGDDEARLGPEDAVPGHGAVVLAYAHGPRHAAVGERAVGIGKRQQRDLGTAERQRCAVVIGGFGQRGQAQVAQRLVEAVDADELQRAHGRHVERTRERRAHADRTAEIAIVVLRNVHAARRGDRERAVVDERCRGQHAIVERQRVEERLQRRAGLPRRDHAVDLRGARQLAAAADVGEHVARRIVEHDERAVLHAALGQLREMFGQRIDREGLHFSVQRARQPLAGNPEQLSREMRRELVVATGPVPAGEGHRGERTDRLAGDLGARDRGDRTRTLRHERRPGRGAAEQGDENRGFARVEARRRLAEQRARCRAQARQLAAIRRQVEIRFEDLSLAPRLLDRAGGFDLVPLLRERACIAAVRAQGGIEQARELHRKRRAAAHAPAIRRAPQAVPGGGREPRPVDTAVLVEALVLGGHQGGAQRGRHVGERHPGAATDRGIHAQVGNRNAPTIEQHGIGGHVGSAHLGERRPLRRRVGRSAGPGWCAEEHERARRSEHAAPGAEAPPTHGCTLQTALGTSPNISGAYIASTRVAGRLNAPGLLRRTVYSVTKRPFGT